VARSASASPWTAAVTPPHWLRAERAHEHERAHHLTPGSAGSHSAVAAPLSRRTPDPCYLQWEDAFAVEFDDGLSFLEPHATIRKANRIPPKAVVASVEMDEELRHGFFVHYDTGQTAEVSWAFIRERPPKYCPQCKRI
jgi:hypothetical protein